MATNSSISIFPVDTLDAADTEVEAPVKKYIMRATRKSSQSVKEQSQKSPDHHADDEAKNATSTGRNRQPEELEEQRQLEISLRAGTRKMLKTLQQEGVPIKVGRSYTGQGLQILPQANRYMDCDGKRYVGFSLR